MIRMERFAACLLAAAMVGLAPADALAQKGKKKKGKKGKEAQVDGARSRGNCPLRVEENGRGAISCLPERGRYGQNPAGPGRRFDHTDKGEDRNPYFYLCCVYFTTMTFV